MGFSLGNYIALNGANIYGKYCLGRYLRISKDPASFGEKTLAGIIRRNKNTEFGKKYGLGDIHSVKEYQERMPYTSYEDYADYIDRMAKKGEQGLMTSDKVTFLALTSGTTGVTKKIPVVSRSFMPIFRSSMIIYRIIAEAARKNGFRWGKGLNSLESRCTYSESGIREGYISSFVMSSAGLVVPFITCIPKQVFGCEGADMKYIKARYALADRDLVYLMTVFMSTMTDLMKYISENRDMLIKDIETGSIDPSVVMPKDLRDTLSKKLKPNKKRAEELKKELDFSRPEGLVKRVWPRMSMIVAIGMGEFETFTKKMKVYAGPTIGFCNEFYAASETIFAGSIEADADSYFMIPDSGLFEFIPMDDEFDEAKDRPLLFDELEVGKHYEVVVTNLAGLYRYRIKDVIKVVGFKNKIPLVRFSYRKSQMINITGVKLTTEHMVSVSHALSERIGVNIIDYSVYPDTDAEPWRLKVFLEFEKDIPENIDLASIFDEELAKVNEEHGEMLRIGETTPSVVYVMKKNAYRELREANAKKKMTDSQVKTIRYINSKEMRDTFMEKVEMVCGKE